MPFQKQWTEEELLYLKNHHKDNTDKRLATMITQLFKRSVTWRAIEHMRQRLGLKKSGGRPWSTRPDKTDN